ncbi:MAG: site-specific integrase [Thermodesulfobacteriota bacterium]|jgi:integrase
MDKHRTKFPGVRYVEHPKRKHGVQRDKYFYIRYQIDGRRREEGLGWLTEKMTAEKAAGILAELKEAKRRGSNEPTTLKARRLKVKAEAEHRKKEGLTFGQFFRDTYFPISKVSKKPESWKKEEEHFRLYLGPVLGNKPLQEMKPLTLERVKKNILDAERSPRFLQYVFATFRQVWNMARRDGLVFEESPTKGVKIQKIENKRVRFLSHEEAGELLAYLKPNNPTIHDMALLSLSTGMRFGEIKSLKWGAVDLDRGLINIFDAKGGNSRTAFMTPEVRAMLTGREKENPEDLVFFTFDGREYTDTPTTFRDAVKELKFNEGITDQRQKVVFHTLRHSYASWLAEAGTDIYTIGKLLGHSTVQMSARYAHLGPGAMQEAVKRLPSLTGKPKKGKVVALKK